MRNYLLGGVAIASAFTFMIASAPASAQAGCGVGHPCVSTHAGPYRAAGAGPAQFRNPAQGYAHGYGRGHGNGIGLGVGAALATGAIIGGAMEENQGYYPASPILPSLIPTRPPPIRIKARATTTRRPAGGRRRRLLSPTASRHTGRTIPPAGPISATTGCGIPARDGDIGRRQVAGA